MSISCSLVDTCLERTDTLGLLYVMYSCAFVTFPYGVLGQVWYMIVAIPDFCLLPYFYMGKPFYKPIEHITTNHISCYIRIWV